MQTLYPSHENVPAYPAVDRADRALSAHSSLVALTEKHEESLFSAPKPVRPKIRGVKNRTQRYRSDRFVQSEDEEDHYDESELES